MLMTVEACAAEGITFAGVHDSYWTHACHVDRMGELLREKFIALHSQPLLENLHQELSRQATKPLDPVPPKGNLDLDVVRRSLYFFC
jgi:DNA-directed RNA polymerase